MKIAVIGAGISGLTAAHRLLKEGDGGLDVQVFEASSRAGGIIETLLEHNCVVELGPDSFTTLKHAAAPFCVELGLGERIIPTNEKYRRALVARKGELLPVPEGFVLIAPTRYDTFFRSRLLSRLGKLRMAFEQFIEKAPLPSDESVASFVRRRFGPEAVGCVAQPMLAGIYTADVEKLSLRATMPQYLEYEEKFGSVSAGLRRSNRDKNEGGARYSAFVSLDSGLQVLTDRLVELISAQRIHLKKPVTELTQVMGGRWRLRFADGDEQVFDGVVMAVATAVASKLLAQTDEQLAEALARIEYASSAVAVLLFDRQQIRHPLDGFGFVVPAREKKKILAASFSSVKFPGRCPTDKVMVRVFLGGTLDPDAWQLPDDELLTRALTDLNFYIGLDGEPERQWLKRWPNSMPQYNVGHLDNADFIEKALASHPGLVYAGSGLRGVGLPDCIASGERAARVILSRESNKTDALQNS